MQRIARLLVAAFVTTLVCSLALAFGGVALAAPAAPQSAHQAHPILLHSQNWLKQHPSRRVGPYVQGSGDLSWHGGPVQHSPVTYAIYWGSSWKNSSGSLNATGQVVQKYFSDMGGTRFENILTQYYDGSGHINNTHNFAGAAIDSSSPPYDYSCGGKTIEDSSIQNEVNNVINALGWPRNSTNAVYYVFTPNGYYVNDGYGDCSEQVFCAYHNWSGYNLAYAAMAYPFSSGCQVPSSPNGNVAGDSLANVTSHEQFEAITDPRLNAWYDSAGYEIGDKCAWDFSKGYTYLNNGGVFELQTEYSNASHSCVNSY